MRRFFYFIFKEYIFAQNTNMFIHIINQVYIIMRKVNYDKFPSTKISGTILRGWNDIHTLLMECFKSRKVLAVELYAGVREDEVINELKSLSPTLLINTRDLMKPENEIKEMTERFMTKDVLFGYVTNLSLKDYFDAGKLEVARKQVAAMIE